MKNIENGGNSSAVNSDNASRAFAGSASIDGTPGHDVLRGGNGGQTINGGNGDDVLYGFGGQDEDPLSGTITATLVASGLPPAVFLQTVPGDPDLHFVATLPGLIFALDTSGAEPEVLQPPVLALPFTPEQQLLGFAMDPDFATNGKVYLNYSAADGTQIISQFTMLNDQTIDPASEQVMLTLPYQPGGEVNRGGWMGFGPDGYLYITTGDGRLPTEEPTDAPQDSVSLLGKVLRLDVSDSLGSNGSYAIPEDNPFASGGGAPEVWALGLRNPFRASFDDAGNFYLGDPSHVSQEEVNVIPAGATAPLNFGWPRYEGTADYDPEVLLGPGTLTGPVLEREAGFGPLQGRATIGGYVYDGPGGMQGLYVFGDFVAPRLFTMQVKNGEVTEFTNRYDQLDFTSGSLGFGDLISFSVDSQGRLFTLELDGEIHLLTPSEGAGDGADALDGGRGDDMLYGGAGADKLLGGLGEDSLWGGLGDDDLSGGSDDDHLHGGRGQDTLSGNAGDDTLHGEEGDDQLYGGSGADELDGGAGNDTLSGSTGDDVARGGDGDDVIAGGEGADWLLGGAGKDRLNGGDGTDNLDGGAGDDLLVGGAGKDWLTGGAGADHFRFVAGDSRPGGGLRDVITDFTSGVDKLDLRPLGITDLAAQSSVQLIGSGMILTIDLDRDGVDYGDFAVQLSGLSSLGAGDILI